MKEKLILLADIEGLGKAGEAVSVASGHARNYLLPQKLALRASKGALKQFEAQKEKVEAKRQDKLKKMQDFAAKIAELEISIPMKVGEDEKLYGSVTSHAIADAIKALGLEIDHHKLVMEGPIKELGTFEIDIKLHPEVTAKAKVWVVRAE